MASEGAAGSLARTMRVGEGGRGVTIAKLGDICVGGTVAGWVGGIKSVLATAVGNGEYEPKTSAS